MCVCVCVFVWESPMSAATRLIDGHRLLVVWPNETLTMAVRHSAMSLGSRMRCSRCKVRVTLLCCGVSD